MTLWTVLMVVCFWVWSLAFGLMLWGTRLSLRRLRASPPHLDAPFNLFPVSIIKPLKGIDAYLSENLEGFFQLEYPDFEILFCIAQASDPARSVVLGLLEKYPHVKARLLMGEEVIGPNPKVNNMIGAYESATHDWVLISDSNVRVTPDYLKRLVAHLRPGVGLVTAVVAGHGARGLGGNLEATFLNTFYVRGMNLAAGLGRACVVGKSMLFRRSTARRFGGLRMLGQFLAEDYMAGEAMQRLGLEVVIACDPVTQVIGDHSFDAFWKRHLRWGRIRKKHAMLAFVLEPWTGSMVSGVLGGWAASRVSGISFLAFLILHLSIWAIGDLASARRMGVTVGKWDAGYWLLRESLALPLWFHIASSNKVSWRGHQLTLRAGGVLTKP